MNLECTCENEYAHDEYIPANLSRYTTLRSVAMNGKTEEQLPIPMHWSKTNIDPRMLKNSCSPSLQDKGKTVF